MLVFELFPTPALLVAAFPGVAVAPIEGPFGPVAPELLPALPALPAGVSVTASEFDGAVASGVAPFGAAPFGAAASGADAPGPAGFGEFPGPSVPPYVIFNFRFFN